MNLVHLRSHYAERLGVQKNILLSFLLITLFSGLYGCSCSSKPSVDPDIVPGLYIADIAVLEDEAGQTQLSLDVKLQRNSTATVTVEYEIKASTSTTKPLATIGGVDDADVDVVSGKNTLTFDETTTDVLTIPVTVLSDSLYELDEVFVVELTVSSNANIIEGVAEITLTNDDPKPVAKIELADVNDSLTLSEATPQRVSIKASLDVVSGVDASLIVTRSSESGLDEAQFGFVAAYRIDYMLFQSDVMLLSQAELVIPAGETEAFIEVEVIDDGLREKLESFDINLDEKSHVSTAGTQALVFSIEDNDTVSDGSVASVKLNDTGVVESPGVSNELKGQVDNSLGRDSIVLTKTGAGKAGFDFTKIDANGSDVSAATAFTSDPSTGIQAWDCVRDNHTGLVWEVKVPGEAVIRGAGQSFYWHDPNYETNAGDAGVKGKFQCEGNDPVVNGPCNSNTAYYVADMNVNKLCGMTGWRLPTIDELRSILDYNTASDTTIHYDTDYFAGDKIGSKYIWTSTSVANSPDQVWTIKFGQLSEEARPKLSSGISGVRLVNDSNVGNN